MNHERYLQVWKESYPTRETVFECLKYVRETGRPVPNSVLDGLIYNMDLLDRGRESNLFEKKGTKPKTHPVKEFWQRDAVSYVLTCQKNDLDKTPVKTICDKFEVTRPTFYKWKKKYKDASDNVSKEYIQYILNGAARSYILIKDKQM